MDFSHVLSQFLACNLAPQILQVVHSFSCLGMTFTSAVRNRLLYRPAPMRLNHLV